MPKSTRMKFVGGQEDGEFYDVPDFMDYMRFPERLEPDTRVFAGSATPVNLTRKVILYVRRGDQMVCDS